MIAEKLNLNFLHKHINREIDMNITKIKSQILIFSISAFLWSCGSTVEYTSAKMALQNENWDEAEKYLLEALKVEPQNAEVMVQIGIHVHARNQQWKEMNEMFKNAISINPEGKALGKPIKEKTQDIRRGFTRSYYEKGVNRYNNYFKTKDKKNLALLWAARATVLLNKSLNINYKNYNNVYMKFKKAVQKPFLIVKQKIGRMAELVDAADSKSAGKP